MGILDSIKRCFGEGVIRFEGITESGEKFSCKMSYIGDINSESREELCREAKNRVLVQIGERVKEIHIVGYY